MRDILPNLSNLSSPYSPILPITSETVAAVTYQMFFNYAPAHSLVIDSALLLKQVLGVLVWRVQGRKGKKSKRRSMQSMVEG